MNSLTRIKRRVKKGRKYGKKNSTHSLFSVCDLSTFYEDRNTGLGSTMDTNTIQNKVSTNKISLNLLKLEDRLNYSNISLNKLVAINLKASVHAIRELACKIESTATVLRLKQEQKDFYAISNLCKVSEAPHCIPNSINRSQ
jgi:hypothetical protein